MKKKRNKRGSRWRQTRAVASTEMSSETAHAEIDENCTRKKMTVLLIKSGIYRDEQQRDFHCKKGGPTSLKHNSKGLTGHSRFHSY